MEVSPGYVVVDGGALYYERAGEGYPVVLIHGQLWDRRIWEPQFHAFAAKHDVIRYDARGYGRSDPPTGPYSDLADLGALLAELGVARCALVGCSAGAGLAIDFALAHPEVAEAIVPVSPSVSGYEWTDRGIDQLADEVRRAVSRGDLRGAMEIELAVWTPTETDPDSDALIRDVAMDNLQVFRIDESLSIPPEPAVDRLDRLQAATLVIVGEKDVEEIHLIAEMLEQRVPGAQKRVIAETDHLVNVRRPDRFNQMVLDFLSFRV